MKKRFLIKCWFPHRGTTEENPAYYQGNCGNLFHAPLHDINVDACYTSYERARRAAGRFGIYTHWKIVEAPEDTLIDNRILADQIVRSGRFDDAIRSFGPDIKKPLCPYWKYWDIRSDADFLKPFLDYYLRTNGKAFSL